MASKAKRQASTRVRRSAPDGAATQLAAAEMPPQLRAFLNNPATPQGFVNPKTITIPELRNRLNTLNVRPTVPLEQLLPSLNRIKPAASPIEKLPEEIRSSVRALKPELRRFHGTKIELAWFPFPFVTSSCAD